MSLARLDRKQDRRFALAKANLSRAVYIDGKMDMAAVHWAQPLSKDDLRRLG